MGSFSGTCEIIEAREELNTGKTTGVYQLSSAFSVAEKNQKHSMLKLGYKNNLDNEINKLFESIHLKTSSRDLGISQNGSSPKMKNASKKPITVGVSHSPRVGTSEPLSLKHALKDLCISKASEMAAMKRLSMLAPSPRVSEVGRIKTLYNSVVAETSQPGPSFIESEGNRIETSVVPKESKSSPMEKAIQYHQTAQITSLLIPTVRSSSSTVIATTQNDIGTTLVQSDLVCSSSKVGVQSQKSEPGQTERQTSLPSPILSNSNKSKSEFPKNASASTKLGNKAFVPKTRRKGRGVVLVTRNKNSSKKKLKQDSGSTISAPTSKEMNNKLVPGSNQLCERCRCALENTSQVNSQNSVVSESTIPGDVSLSNVHSGPNKPTSSSSSCNISRSVPKVKKNARLKEQLEFSQSSKSSQGEYSSSTCTSVESNAIGSSCGIRPHMSKDVRWEAIRHAQMQHGVLGLRHFNLLKKLGCGDIGTVYLAELVGTNCLFAIKVMDNEFLARRKKMPRAQTEREILRILDHPFLPTMYAQFTSDNLSCLVMEYCPGGDLHVLRQKQLGRSFSEKAARFYVAEVLLALEYLHMLGIVYRDLKPENILVREDGHIMLTDFDLSLRCVVRPMLLKSSFDVDPAKISGPRAQSSCIEPLCIEPSCQVPCFSPRILPDSAKARKLKADLPDQIRSLPQLVAEPTDARSNSFVGTHEYLAPEIVKGEGHGAAVDWWTFGVFLYELLYGRTPFKGSNNEETLANVVLQSLRFPDIPFVSFQARDLIRGLLVKEPENRLGSQKGAAEIKQHSFFEGLNWALIRCAIPPELPEFCDFGVSDITSLGKGKYFECKAAGEHVEFELF